MATELKFMLDDEIRRRQRSRGIAGIDRVLKTQIVAELRVDRRAVGGQRFHHIHHGG